MTWRFGERGYRYLMIDAGHICQNLYLTAGAIKFGACAIGAFDDNAMNEILGLDGENAFVLYGASVGK
jgi:SagB-type dehydrogenase family enzyme